MGDLPDRSLLDGAFAVLSLVSLVALIVIYAVYVATVVRDLRTDSRMVDSLRADGAGFVARASRWILLALPTVTLGYILIAVVQFRLLAVLPFWLLAAVIGGIFLLHLFAPIAFHVDSGRVARATGWRPSSIYYLTVIVSGPGAALAALYLLQRRRHLRATGERTESQEPAATDADQGLSDRMRSLSRRDVFKVAAIGYAAYLGYRFFGSWIENEVKGALFGSPPEFADEVDGWPMQNYGPGQTAANGSASVPTGDLAVTKLYAGRDPNADDGPVYHDGVVFFCGRPRVYAVDVNSREVLWTYRTKETGPFADDETWARPHAIAFDGESVLVSIDLGLTALDPATGEERWSHRTGSLFRDLTVSGNTAFLGVHGITAIDTTIGTKRWHVDWSTGPSTPPAVVGGTVFGSHNASIEDGNHEWVIRAIDGRSGDSEWTRRVDLGSSSRATNAPVRNGTIYFGGSHLFAFDAGSGETLWRREDVIGDDTTYGLVADGARLYAIPYDHSDQPEPVQAFDASNGELVWSRGTPADTRVAGSAAGDVLCLTQEDRLELLNAGSGDLLTAVEHDFSFPDPPRIVDDLILVEGFEEIYTVTEA